MKRVVVTGLGAITPLGNTVDQFWDNIVNGVSGAGPITRFDAGKFKTRFACEVKGFAPESFLERKEIRKYDLFTLYALAASDQALVDAGLDYSALSQTEREHTGVVWASGNGGIGTFEEQVREFVQGDGTPRFNPFFIPKMIADIAAGAISIRHKLHGPNYCTVAACASSNTALINALDTIRLGRADVMIAGGSEAAITPASVGGFNAAHALSKNNDDQKGASRPFDVTRDGFVIGEGAGALILESLDHAVARGAKIYAEMAGGGMAADAYHLTGTPPDGIGGALGSRQALRDSGMVPADISYINAHATSTHLGDISEMAGVKKVFGNLPVPISATKSMTGHLLGAAGAIESIISILSVVHDIIPGTINTKNPDPELPAGLNLIIGKSLHQPVHAVLNNTFGFGGHTSSSVFKKYVK